MTSTHTWILFDIDATLMDHEEAFRAGTAALHGHSGAHSDFADFAARWSEAHRRKRPIGAATRQARASWNRGSVRARHDLGGLRRREARPEDL
jgi:FMN phosphatase YigB (HAD superfamily)